MPAARILYQDNGNNYVAKIKGVSPLILLLSDGITPGHKNEWFQFAFSSLQQSQGYDANIPFSPKYEVPKDDYIVARKIMRNTNNIFPKIFAAIKDTSSPSNEDAYLIIGRAMAWNYFLPEGFFPKYDGKYPNKEAQFVYLSRTKTPLEEEILSDCERKEGKSLIETAEGKGLLFEFPLNLDNAGKFENFITSLANFENKDLTSLIDYSIQQREHNKNLHIKGT